MRQSLFRRFSVISVALLAWMAFPPLAPAPIYGGFPGLDHLIEGADTIAVVRIGSQRDVPPMTMEGYREFPSINLRSIKGSWPEGQSQEISLRFLSRGYAWPEDTAWLQSPEAYQASSGPPAREFDLDSQALQEFGPLRDGSMHLVFFHDGPTQSTRVTSGPPAVAHSMNSEGSIFPLAPGTGLFPELDASPEEVIERIVHDSTQRWADSADRAFPDHRPSISSVRPSPTSPETMVMTFRTDPAVHWPAERVDEIAEQLERGFLGTE